MNNLLTYQKWNNELNEDFKSSLKEKIEKLKGWISKNKKPIIYSSISITFLALIIGIYIKQNKDKKLLQKEIEDKIKKGIENLSEKEKKEIHQNQVDIYNKLSEELKSNINKNNKEINLNLLKVLSPMKNTDTRLKIDVNKNQKNIETIKAILTDITIIIQKLNGGGSEIPPPSLN